MSLKEKLWNEIVTNYRLAEGDYRDGRGRKTHATGKALGSAMTHTLVADRLVRYLGEEANVPPHLFSNIQSAARQEANRVELSEYSLAIKNEVLA